MSPTAIEWTEETWNPVTGCTKVSAGCDNCYAERITERFHGKGSFDEIVLHHDRLETPLRWRKPRTVFVNSMSDLFHADVPRSFIAKVFAIMALSPRHTFQILTKRPGRMRSLLANPTFPGEVEAAGFQMFQEIPVLPKTFSDGYDGLGVWPYFHVWLGVSVEDQEHANKRIPALLDTPAAVRFLSCEPLLGKIDFNECKAWNPQDNRYYLEGIDWVIVGGESGLRARPMEPEWVRLLRQQCTLTQVPFFFKQWGGRTPKANGRELDGRTWDEMPRTDRAFTAHRSSSRDNGS